MEHSVSTTAPDPDATEIGSVSTGGASEERIPVAPGTPSGGLPAATATRSLAHKDSTRRGPAKPIDGATATHAMEQSVSSSSPARDAMASGPVSTSGASGDADSDRARNPFGGLASGNGSALFGAQGEHETKRPRTKRWSNGDGPDGALGEHRGARPRCDGKRFGEHGRSIGDADSDRVRNRFWPSASLRVLYSHRHHFGLSQDCAGRLA